MGHTAALVAGYRLKMANTPGPYLAAGSQPTMAIRVADTFPPTVLIAVTGLVPGQTVTVSRRQAGSNERVPVRGADGVVVTSDALALVDAEQPLGVVLTYRLTVDGVDLDPTLDVFCELQGVALTDAINGNAAQAIILAWPEQSRSRNSTVFSVAGRNIVVTGARSQFASTIELYTETETARQSMLALLDNATGGTIQLRNGVGHFGEDGYYAVLDDTEQRWSQDGSDERRRWMLNVVETGPWAASLLPSTFTLGDIGEVYAALSLADFAADYPNLLAAAQGDYS